MEEVCMGGCEAVGDEVSSLSEEQELCGAEERPSEGQLQTVPDCITPNSPFLGNTHATVAPGRAARYTCGRQLCSP